MNRHVTIAAVVLLLCIAVHAQDSQPAGDLQLPIANCQLPEGMPQTQPASAVSATSAVKPPSGVSEVLLLLLAPMITAVVQWLRKVPAVNDRPRLLPFLAVASGIVMALGDLVLLTAEPLTGAAIQAAIVSGIVAGLVACGLYSAGAKVVLEKLIASAGSRWLRLLILSAVLAISNLSGCNRPPASVTDTLYGAQLTAEMTVQDATAARPGSVWEAPAADATDAEKLAVERRRTAVLLDACRSIDKNLSAILYYYRVSDPMAALKGQEAPPGGE